MNIESRINKIIKVGALSATLLLSPVLHMQEVYAQTIASRTEYKDEFYRIQVKKYTDKFDILLKSYDLGTAKAIYSGYASGLTLEDAISNAKQVASNPTIGTFPKELQYSIIRSAKKDTIKDIATFLTELNKIIKDALGPKYDYNVEMRKLCPLIETINYGSLYSEQDLIDIYYNYDLRPIDNGDFIKAASKTYSIDLETLFKFGSSLIEEKKYPQDVAGAVLYAYAKDKNIKDNLIKLTDSLIAKGYSNNIIKGIVIAYELGDWIEKDPLGKDMWIRNSHDDLAYVVKILKGKYDDDVISDTLKLFVKAEI